MNTLSLLAGIASTFTVTLGSAAAYTNLSVTSVDATIVLDPGDPSDTAVTIHRVWANFTDPDDGLFVWGGGGTLGSAVIRNLDASGSGAGTGFLNHAFESGAFPPNSSTVVSGGDSFFTLGVTLLNQIPAGQGVSLIAIPGTPPLAGTTIDLDGGGGVTTPPTTSGSAANPIALAGFKDDGDEELRVLLMQLIVPQGEQVAGSIGVTVNPASLDGASVTLQNQSFGGTDGNELARPDFNDDGFADIAIGVPGKNRRAISNSGAGIIMYGNSGGINGSNAALWHQDSNNIPDQCEANDELGRALAWGDFDSDGFDDIAIGVPSESIGDATNAGVVHVFYGRSNQITPNNGDLWHQNRPGVADQAEEGDGFGGALVAGDFDDDGFDDLAIGVGDEDLGSDVRAGAVHVLYGSEDGLRGNGSQFFHADSPGIAGNPRFNDHFGAALGAGDFDGDGAADLAIGIPRREVQGRTDAGAVNVIYGSVDGLNTGGSQYWHQGALAGVLEAFDQFGSTIATGDFDNDGRDDLAVAATHESIPPERDVGAVNVAFGSPTGLTAAGTQFFDATDVLGDPPREGNLFGTALACGDLNDDGFDELIIGTPARKLQGLDSAGIVALIAGSAGGLDPFDIEMWHVERMTITGEITEHANFGAALMCADFNGDAIVDLAVGMPGGDVGGPAGGGGAVVVTLGTPSGLQQNTGQIWGQSSIGQAGAGGDSMGAALPK